MKKAILIGNGFTSNLISDFRNEQMMDKFFEKENELVNNIESLFDNIRNLSIEDAELLSISDELTQNEQLTSSTDSIVISNIVKEHVVMKLTQLKFNDPRNIFKLYFDEYGLWSSVNSKKLNGIETYLKVIELFKEIDKFSKKEYNRIKNIATEIYYNCGKHGLKDIDNYDISKDKLIHVIKKFDYVFTTNYDTILDDILNSDEEFPYHLHGGFSIKHKNEDPNGRYSPKDARLIWGINAEEKYDELRGGFSYSDLKYSAVRYAQSRLADYYDILQKNKIDEIHILGYSGENDDHINQRIIKNEFIKKVIVYVNPNTVNKSETKVRNRLLFGRQKKLVELRPWSEFWNEVVNEIDKD